MDLFPPRGLLPEQSLEELLFHARDEERKRIARDLHDSTGQLLTALRLNLARLKEHPSAETNAIVKDCNETLDQLFKEVRTFTFLGHPPALQEQHLIEALGQLISGYQDRTGISVQQKLLVDERLPAPVEACIYRIVQEALINVYRHASATEVGVGLVRAGRKIRLRVSDNGPNETLDEWNVGVGLSSMTERAEELGGTFTIHRSSEGTMLLASIPLDQP